MAHVFDMATLNNFFLHATALIRMQSVLFMGSWASRVMCDESVWVFLCIGGGLVWRLVCVEILDCFSFVVCFIVVVMDDYSCFSISFSLSLSVCWLHDSAADDCFVCVLGLVGGAMHDAAVAVTSISFITSVAPTGAWCLSCVLPSTDLICYFVYSTPSPVHCMWLCVHMYVFVEDCFSQVGN